MCSFSQRGEGLVLNKPDLSLLERTKSIQKYLFFLGLFLISRTGVLFTAQAQVQVDAVAWTLFRQLDPGQVFELTFPSELTNSLRFDLGEEMTLQDLTVFRDELVLGGRFAQYFYPNPTVYRRNLEGSITRLIAEMAAAGMRSVRLSDIQSRAVAKIQEKMMRKAATGLILKGSCLVVFNSTVGVEP
jgi:hypothetical protein